MQTQSNNKEPEGREKEGHTHTFTERERREAQSETVKVEGGVAGCNEFFVVCVGFSHLSTASKLGLSYNSEFPFGAGTSKILRITTLQCFANHSGSRPFIHSQLEVVTFSG